MQGGTGRPGASRLEGVRPPTEQEGLSIASHRVDGRFADEWSANRKRHCGKSKPEVPDVWSVTWKSAADHDGS